MQFPKYTMNLEAQIVNLTQKKNVITRDPIKKISYNDKVKYSILTSFRGSSSFLLTIQSQNVGAFLRMKTDVRA